jgi:predicted GIY-YIG superfamily endonuclease
VQASHFEAEPMFYTYILRSIECPEKHYTGHTADLKIRLAEHNRGKCPQTAKFAPWKLQCYFAFETENLARNFERYLKSGSGRAFAKKHFEENSPPGVSDSDP